MQITRNNCNILYINKEYIHNEKLYKNTRIQLPNTGHKCKILEIQAK